MRPLWRNEQVYRRRKKLWALYSLKHQSFWVPVQRRVISSHEPQRDRVLCDCSVEFFWSRANKPGCVSNLYANLSNQYSTLVYQPARLPKHKLESRYNEKWKIQLSKRIVGLKERIRARNWRLYHRAQEDCWGYACIRRLSLFKPRKAWKVKNQEEKRQNQSKTHSKPE